MSPSVVDIPVDAFTDFKSDYDDGFASMTKLMKRLSASAVVVYGEDSGPKLDGMASESPFFSGLADGLASQVAAAFDRNPDLTSDWLKGCTIHVEVNGRDKTFRVERRTS